MTTPAQWRAVDDILQRALTCERERRDAMVAEACGADEVLRREVVSLLAVHDALPGEFLERPAVLDAAGVAAPPPSSPVTPTPPRRVVAARVVVYATIAALLLGALGGWTAARLDVVENLTRALTARLPSGSASPPAVGADAADLSLVIADRAGHVQRTIAAARPWTPRFSPDGRRIAYGAFGQGRNTSDVWVTNLDDGTTTRLTEDDKDANDPQWSPDGTLVAYSVNAPGGKDIAARAIAGGPSHVVAARPGTQFASDWLRDGSALLVTDDAGAGKHDVLVQPADGSAPRPYVATGADELSARASPDGRWVAYVSDESGRPEVYMNSYPAPGRRVSISHDGGQDPVWRGDGKELYYWRGDALVAVEVRAPTATTPPVLGGETVLFHAAYEPGWNTMYDVSRDGQRFVIVRHR